MRGMTSGTRAGQMDAIMQGGSSDGVRIDRLSDTTTSHWMPGPRGSKRVRYKDSGRTDPANRLRVFILTPLTPRQYVRRERTCLLPI